MFSSPTVGIITPELRLLIMGKKPNGTPMGRGTSSSTIYDGPIIIFLVFLPLTYCAFVMAR